MLTEETVLYADIWYQVKYSFGRYKEDFCGLSFVAHKIRTMSEDYAGNQFVEELCEGEVLNGTIKFDGCMNVVLEEGYAHFCGRKETAQYAELFNRIYDKAKAVGCED